jgi:tetraacyldisaccharide 4'-kinase
LSVLTKKWYEGHPIFWLLFPLTLVFWVVSWLRRTLFTLGIRRAYRADVPVIVVGNISVGGNGKTPVVLALSDYYKTKGLRVGILSRGYGGKSPYYPRQVLPDDIAHEVGDEPRLLAIRSGAVVVIDPVRARGAEYLVKTCQCDIIICDDGLQHYALARDAEIVVMDERMLGSGLLMPMGPLREGKWRLSHVNAIVHNRLDGKTPLPDALNSAQFAMTLTPGRITNVCDTDQKLTVDELSARAPTAIAGIGSPERFFNQLGALGVKLQSANAFPDHYAYERDDIPSSTVIMTEKDAVKVQGFCHQDCWFLPVTATIDQRFFEIIETTISKCGLKTKAKDKG